jgi:hypothetical protein
MNSVRRASEGTKPKRLLTAGQPETVTHICQKHAELSQFRICLRFMAGALVVGLALGLVRLSSKRSAPASATLPVSIEPAVFDFGQLLQRQVVSYAFLLTNSSTRPMRILAHRTTCSCTVVGTGYEGQELAAHSSLQLPITFESGARDGPFSSSVTVLLQQGERKHVAQAQLRGEIIPDFRITPGILDFGTMRPLDHLVRTVSVSAGALTEMSIEQGKPLPPGFVVTIDRSGTPRGHPYLATLSISFTAPATGTSQLVDQNLEFATSSRRVPILRIPTRAIVMPDIEIVPPVVVLSSPGIAAKSRFTVRSSRESRIANIWARSAGGLCALNAVPDHEDVSKGAWSREHTFQIRTSALAQAVALEVDVEMETEAGHRQVQSVSARVKNLLVKEKDSKPKD